MEHIIILAEAIIGGTIAVCIAVLLLRWAEKNKKQTALSANLVSPCIFLFRDGQLVDATPPARHIFLSCGNEYGAFKAWLGRKFDGFADLDLRISGDGVAEFFGRTGSGTARQRLLAEEVTEGGLRMTLVQPDSETAGIVVDSLSQQAMEEELALLRELVECAPMLITRRDCEGRIEWANASYLRAADRCAPDAPGWPLPDVMQPAVTPNPQGRNNRVHIDDEDGVHWFDCHEHRDGDGVTTYAFPADGEVRAEQSLREFLQTLTKTFADLPIGLAIFDRDRLLQLFNPALIDLTGLPAGFLTSRPSLYAFLDQLRETRMVPEPRDYRSWRKQISNLESAAAAGHHVETWSLPGGRTYRVTGRPHPGGAVAFLFDDITSEMTVTRRFRAELNLSAHVLDGLQGALIVFDATGEVMLTNRAYIDLWGPKPARMADALILWQGEWSCAPGLPELERSLIAKTDSGPTSGILFNPNGEGVLNWAITSLPGGKRMVTFEKSSSTDFPKVIEANPAHSSDDSQYKSVGT